MPEDQQQGRFDLFISYAHLDSSVVTKVVRRLHEYGLDCFLDNWRLRGGDILPNSLQGALARSEGALIFISTAFAQSQWCHAELEWMTAEARHRTSLRLIPIRLDPTPIPQELADRISYDLLNPSEANIIKVSDRIWEAFGKKGGPGIFGRSQVLTDKVVSRIRNVIEGLGLERTHPKLVEIASLIAKPLCCTRDAGPCQCGGITLCGFINLGLVDWYSNFFHVCVECFRHDHQEVYTGATQENGAERICPWCEPLWMW